VNDPVASAYAQLFSVGVLWMSVHCVGMCGPIVSGLPLTKKKGFLAELLGVLRYQGGRAVIYALLGSIAGLVGGGLTKVFEPAGGVLALLLGVAMIAWLVRRVVRAKQAVVEVEPLVQLSRPKKTRLARALEVVRSLPPSGIGAVFALLPCMIPVWVMGLAAITGSPVHGALLMLSVVLLTTPILALVRAGGGLALRRAPAWVPSALRVVSAGWLVLVGAAALGWIDHQHLMFEMSGREFYVMFF
jgi:sulfite exporter TauE/SafE